MKVRSRKAHINFTLARELWLTPQRKYAAKVIVARSDEYRKQGKLQPYDEAEMNRIFEEILNEKN